MVSLLDWYSIKGLKTNGDPNSLLLPVFVESPHLAFSPAKKQLIGGTGEPIGKKPPDLPIPLTIEGLAVKLMQDMTEPELKEYFNLLMSATKEVMPPDVLGFMIICFQADKITQYAASIEPEGAIQALRELADRLERREAVTR